MTEGCLDELSTFKPTHCAIAAGISDGDDTLGINDSKSELQKAFLETQENQPYRLQSTALQSLVGNWIYLKENSNATTWKNKFLKLKLLSEKDLVTVGAKLKRSELAEWLLLKTLQKVETQEEFELIQNVIYKDLGGTPPRRTKAKHVPSQEPKENLPKVKEMLLKNRCKLEELLSREDAVAIKDHLVQDEIINLSENETLLKQEKRFQDKKSSLISEVIEMVIIKLHLGSYQCLTESLATIKNTKRQQQINKLLTDVRVADAMQSGLEQIQIKHMPSTFYEKDIDDKTNFKLTLKATNQSGLELKEVYSQITNNPETVDITFASSLVSSPEKTSEGSLVIHFQMIERNMQDYLKQCLRNGNVSTVIDMICNEISIENVLPSGEILIRVKIEVNEDSNLTDSNSTESFSEYLSGKKFVPDNRSFLIEEIDTDAIKEGLKKYGIELPLFVGHKERKKKATFIVNYILNNHYEDQFMLVIRHNEGFGYVLQRLETYEAVYTTDPSCLRKNVLLQFSKIVKDIDVDDIRDVFLERHTVINGIILERIKRRDICMATLLIKILKDSEALRAFVDALFIIDWSEAKQLIRWHSQNKVVERRSEVEICVSSSRNNLLFDGSYKVSIDERGSKITIGDNVRVKPTVTTPTYGWGYVTPSSIGIVTAIKPNASDVVIDFPLNHHWNGIIEEMKIVKRTHPCIRCHGCNLYSFVGNRYKCQLCENFNFCENCFRRKKHRHLFTRICEPGSTIKIGDNVRVKPFITSPMYHWGNATPRSIGKVTAIKQNGRDVEIDFPDHHLWKGIIEEMEAVPSIYPVVHCYGYNLFPFAGNRYKCQCYKNFHFCENCVRSNNHRHTVTKIGETANSIY